MQIYAYRVKTRITGSHDFVAASHSHNRWAVFLFIDEKRFAKYFTPTHMPRTYEPWIIQLYTHARQTQTKFKHSNVWVQRHHACPPPAVAAHRWTTSTEIICLSVLVAPYVAAAHPFFPCVCNRDTCINDMCAVFIQSVSPQSWWAHCFRPTVLSQYYGASEYVVRNGKSYTSNAMLLLRKRPLGSHTHNHTRTRSTRIGGRSEVLTWFVCAPICLFNVCAAHM